MADRELAQTLAEVLGEVATVTAEPDGSLTVAVAGAVAALRVLTVADGLEMVSLNQPLAWDLPDTAETRDTVLRQAAATMLGTVTAVERPDPDAAGTVVDVLLRYNFPGSGLSAEALRTLILMVLAAGADLRRELLG